MSRISGPASRSIRFSNVGCLVATLALLTAAQAVATTAQASSARAGKDGLDRPFGVASDRTHVWVVNNNGPTSPAYIGSVTELRSSTGALVKDIDASSYQFNYPSEIASDGTYVWVVNSIGWVTELRASTGALVKVIKGSKYKFNYPDAIASDGTYVWVAKAPGGGGEEQGWVTELRASTGALVRVIRGDGINAPHAVASDGTHVWVANQWTRTITELNAKTGALVKFIQGSSYQFNLPVAISSVGKYVWVANQPCVFNNVYKCSNSLGNSVTELNASTGALVQVI